MYAIAFNAQILTEPRGGTVRYIYNLLDALGKIDTSNEYYLLSSRSLEPATGNSSKSSLGNCRMGDFALRLQDSKSSSGSSARSPEQRAGYRRISCMCLISTLHSAHLASLPFVILDVIPQRFPEYRTTPSEKVFAELAVRAAHRAAAVITISNYCKQDTSTHSVYPPIVYSSRIWPLITACGRRRSKRSMNYARGSVCPVHSY